MTAEPDRPVTHGEVALRRRRRWLTLIIMAVMVLSVLGLAVVGVGISLLVRTAHDGAPVYSDNLKHFEHGSIGAEKESGLPYWVWRALPQLFPEAFDSKGDYRPFGFIYRTNEEGQREDLPIGISRRNYRGVELVWFNCAVCHTGTWRRTEADVPTIVPGMPSNNLDLYRFIRFILDAAVDERFEPTNVMTAMEQAGAKFGPIEKLLWLYYIIPRVREGMIMRRSRLYAFMAEQAAWGPGRVDTFNPYKLVQMHMLFGALANYERFGVSDFPSIFNQRPREGMHLHWDGNNTSLGERNLSAAIGAGVTLATVDLDSIDRVANWLLDLRPPPSPHEVAPAAAARGRSIYMATCAACHGYQNASGYVFEGPELGKVEPNAMLGVDPGRLDSYTVDFRQRQIDNFKFKYFEKTDGYANLPLDGLWLRGPYLHNGSVPTLRDLLASPSERPMTYVRGLDVVDGHNGGFIAPPCDPAHKPVRGFCYDTRLPGNRNSGHVYGTTLSAEEKSDLIAYLLTF